MREQVSLGDVFRGRTGGRDRSARRDDEVAAGAVGVVVGLRAVDAAGGPIAGPDFDAASQRAVLSDADCRASLERILQDPPIVQGRRG